MRTLLGSGLWRDLLALFISAVLLGGMLAGGASRLVEAYFSRAVTGLVGAPGEYDAIVHLKQEAGEAALRALDERLASLYPGYTWKEAPTLAGRLNVVIGLPEAHRNQSGLESLPQTLGDLPGFDGITYIVEPAVVIKDVHPALRDELAAGARAASGVAFAFSSGSTVWAVLRSPGEAAAVQEALEALVEEQVIAEVQLPVAVSEGAREALLAEMISLLEASGPGVRAVPLAAGEGSEGPQAALERARGIIAGLSSMDLPALREDLLRLADQIEAAAAGGDAAGEEGLAYVLDVFRRAVDEVEALEARVAQVAEALRGAAAQGDAGDILVALLLQQLVQRLGGGEAALPGPAVDSEALRAGIQAVEEALERWRELDLEAAAHSLRQLSAAVPGIEPGQVQEILDALDALLAQSQEGTARVSLLIRGAPDPRQALAAVQEAAGPSARVFARSAGVVQPDARTAVLQLLAGLRQVVTILVSLLVLALVLLFDVAPLVSFARRLAEIDGESPALAAAALSLAGGLFGAAAYWGAVWLASGADPLSGSWMVPLGGGLCGALFALASERCAPVEREVVHAAVSLGVAERDILREVVVPQGRPGLLYWLNRPGRRLGRRGGVTAVASPAAPV